MPRLNYSPPCLQLSNDELLNEKATLYSGGGMWDVKSPVVGSRHSFKSPLWYSYGQQRRVRPRWALMQWVVILGAFIGGCSLGYFYSGSSSRSPPLPSPSKAPVAVARVPLLTHPIAPPPTRKAASPLPPGPPMNPFSLPGFITNQPIIDRSLPEGRAYFDYDQVRWQPVPASSTRSRSASRPMHWQEEPSLMKELKTAHKEGKFEGEMWDWARNKTILCIGDSIMRQNLLYFAMHISQDIMREFFDYHDTPGKKWRPEEHMGIVDVPELNFKMANWFHNGMIEETIPTFFPGQNVPQRFEDKLEQVFLPSLNDPLGLDGRTPELIIFESLSWDLVFLQALASHNGDTQLHGRPLEDIELAWYRQRITHILSLLQKQFPTTKIVIQTAHNGFKAHENVMSPVRMWQQGEAIRSVALSVGIELFDWGRIVTPLNQETIDGLHFKPGSGSWLWGEMALTFLKRAVLWPERKTRKYIDLSGEQRRVSQADMAASYETAPEPKIFYEKLTFT